MGSLKFVWGSRLRARQLERYANSAARAPYFLLRAVFLAVTTDAEYGCMTHAKMPGATRFSESGLRLSEGQKS